MSKQGIFAITAALLLAACTNNEGVCYIEGESCWQGSWWQGDSGKTHCENSSGTWMVECPNGETCLGRCQTDDDIDWYYWPRWVNEAAAAADCTDDGYAWTPGCGGGPAQYDWFTTPCADMGGQSLASGACHIPCTEYAQCPIVGMQCGNSYHPYCMIVGCSSASDCGPSGWSCCTECYGAMCLLACTTPTPGVQSAECPEGDFCNDALGCETLPSANCGEPCPAGCCSSTGLTCCEPPFCSGECAGSGCC